MVAKQKTAQPLTFYQLLDIENPLQIVGVINAYTALLAAKAGFRAVYVSGAGVANAAFGLPDLGLTGLQEVCEEVRRINAVCNLPILVDADTGWGSSLNVQRSIRQLAKAGAAAIHIEDQCGNKRCGHRPGKQLVSSKTMMRRIQVAVDAKPNDTLVVMARTDALAVEGLSATINRAQHYQQAGADMLFAEAFTSLAQFRQLTDSVDIPVLANITEFGNTPLFHLDELRQAGVSLILYPLSAFRAMNNAALDVLEVIRQQGSQHEMITRMQNRDALYEILNYHAFEQLLEQDWEIDR